MIEHPIAVLGAGNAGHAIAADLTLAGYQVNLYEHPQFKSDFTPTLERGVIEIEDSRTGRSAEARIHKMTTDIKDAIADINLILVAVPTFGQELFMDTMIPHLREGQIVCFLTGNLGSILLHRRLCERGGEGKPIICETNTQPFGARLIAPAKVRLISGNGAWFQSNIAPGIPRVVSAMPASDSGVAHEEIRRIYPDHIRANNVIVVALSNYNPYFHTVGVLLNAGRIEYFKGNFHLQSEGIYPCPSVQRVIGGLMREMANIIESMGADVILTLEAYMDHVQQLAAPGGTATTPLDSLLSANALETRYITEDIPFGLVPMAELGRKFGVATPIANAIIEIASVIRDKDYRSSGRTLESLGLGKLGREQLVRFVEVGSVD